MLVLVIRSLLRVHRIKLSGCCSSYGQSQFLRMLRIPKPQYELDIHEITLYNIIDKFAAFRPLNLTHCQFDTFTDEIGHTDQNLQDYRVFLSNLVTRFPFHKLVTVESGKHREMACL